MCVKKSSIRSFGVCSLSRVDAFLTELAFIVKHKTYRGHKKKIHIKAKQKKILIHTQVLYYTITVTKTHFFSTVRRKEKKNTSKTNRTEDTEKTQKLLFQNDRDRERGREREKKRRIRFTYLFIFFRVCCSYFIYFIIINLVVVFFLAPSLK